MAFISAPDLKMKNHKIFKDK